MMRKRRILISFFVLGCIARLTASPRLNIYTFAEIDSLQKIERRNVVVFIHTEWCKYCQAMQQTTFKNKEVLDALNEKFWFAAIDAEAKKDIPFNGKVYLYKPTGSNTGIHQLAEHLGTINGQVSYPTICLLNAEHKIIYQYNQYLSSKDLLKILYKL